MRSPEGGVALLEVLAAILILSVAGLALLELVSAGTRAVTTARARERELADEERLLAAYTLLTRSDLDRRLGQREVGPYVAQVERPERMLYRIALGRRVVPDVSGPRDRRLSPGARPCALRPSAERAARGSP